MMMFQNLLVIAWAIQCRGHKTLTLSGVLKITRDQNYLTLLYTDIFIEKMREAFLTFFQQKILGYFRY